MTYEFKPNPQTSKTSPWRSNFPTNEEISIVDTRAKSKAKTTTTIDAYKGNSNTTSTLSIEIILAKEIDESIVKSCKGECKSTSGNMFSDIIVCLGYEHSVPPKCPNN